MNKFKLILIFFLSVTTLISCKSDDGVDSIDIQELAQQVGGLMSAVDETGGQDGNISFLNQEKEIFARKLKQPVKTYSIKDALITKAFAAQCSEVNTFSSCSANQIIRDFDECLVGGALFTGTVNLTFNDNGNACQINDDGESVTRAPNFNISGTRGGEMEVTTSGNTGQTLTRTSAGTYSFSNDGIRRRIRISGVTIFDFETTTGSPIAIQGSSRTNRVITGGSLETRNILSGRECEISPSNVTWASNCTCATSGSWTGSCSEGEEVAISITGCGTAQIVVGEESRDLTFYRCESL